MCERDDIYIVTAVITHVSLTFAEPEPGGIPTTATAPESWKTRLLANQPPHIPLPAVAPELLCMGTPDPGTPTVEERAGLQGRKNPPSDPTSHISSRRGSGGSRGS